MGLITDNNYPSFIEEENMAARGYRLIAGGDEAGRGPLAGPVVAAAVLLPLPFTENTLAGVRDSKLLSARQRESLYHRIQETAISVGVGIIDNLEIDRRGNMLSSAWKIKILS